MAVVALAMTAAMVFVAVAAGAMVVKTMDKTRKTAIGGSYQYKNGGFPAKMSLIYDAYFARRDISAAFKQKKKR